MPPARIIQLPEVQLSVHEAGEGPAVVLCHGFPDLARSWRHQLAALADAGYRAIAPDQRGYGGSDAPANLEDYDLPHLTGDLVALLDALEIERAVFVGHDWGGFVAWAMPLLHPDRCAGVIGVNTPYMPGVSTELMKLAFSDPDKLYILWFQQTEIPEQEMDPKARMIFERLYRRAQQPKSSATLTEMADANPFLNIEKVPIAGESLFDDAELDAYVDAYRANGFRGPVNWYRNLDRNLKLVPGMGVQKLDLPCLMVTAAWDRALTPALADGMPALCSDYERVDIDACGHWTPREKPEALTAAMIDWLGRKIRDA